MGGGGERQGVCEPRIEVIVKMEKKVGVRTGWLGGGQGGGERRINMISYCENAKKKLRGDQWGSRSGDQDGCKRRIEVMVKMKKKVGGGGPVGVGRGLVRVMVNEELKLL